MINQSRAAGLRLCCTAAALQASSVCAHECTATMSQTNARRRRRSDAGSPAHATRLTNARWRPKSARRSPSRKDIAQQFSKSPYLGSAAPAAGGNHRSRGSPGVVGRRRGASPAKGETVERPRSPILPSFRPSRESAAAQPRTSQNEHDSGVFGLGGREQHILAHERARAVPASITYEVSLRYHAMHTGCSPHTHFAGPFLFGRQP